MRYILWFACLFFCSGAIVGMNFNNNSESILHNNQESLGTVHEDSVDEGVIDQDRYNEILRDVEEKWDERNEEYSKIIQEFYDCLSCDYEECPRLINAMLEKIGCVDAYSDFIKSQYFWSFFVIIGRYSTTDRWCISTLNLNVQQDIVDKIINLHSDTLDIFDMCENCNFSCKDLLIKNIVSYFFAGCN